jgi:hypothetical protein
MKRWGGGRGEEKGEGDSEKKFLNIKATEAQMFLMMYRTYLMQQTKNKTIYLISCGSYNRAQK